MKKKTLVLSLLGVFFLILSGAAGMVRLMSVSKPLPVYGELRPFELIDQSGKTFNSGQDIHGPWLVDFIFTRCGGTCPLLTQEMSRIQKTFEKKLKLISISVDPKYDTASRLSEYARRRKLNTDHWHFLTGNQKRIQALMREDFKVGSDRNPIYHSDRFVLVDGKNRIRGYYSLEDKVQLKKLDADIAYLLKTE